jgi:hypothetical protein
MGIDEAYDHLRVGPISLAKYALVPWEAQQANTFPNDWQEHQ